MADDTKQDPSETDDKKPEVKDEAKPDDLAAMKAALKKANKEAEAARLKLKEIEDKDKSESEKAAERAATAEKRAQEAELRAMRLEVAVSKGLTPAQAKRLVGTTQEELEADAEEFLESIRPDDKGKPPGGKPREDLRGGGDPSDEPEEMDPRKLAEMVPRSY
jgi:hypothetical protein